MSAAARWRTVAVAVAIFVVTLAIYMSNGETISSYDSGPNTVFAYNAIEHGALDFDRFRGGELAGLGGAYAFVEAPNGHLTSLFPIGTAFLTFPVYALLFAVEHPGDVAATGFEPQRLHDEKLVASIVAALAAMLFFGCARLIGTGWQAGIATVAFALGTETWMIGSQGLWQHGPVCLVLIALIFSLLRAERAGGTNTRAAWMLAAGLLAGFLPVIRPTALLFTIAAAAFALTTLTAGRRLFIGGVVLGLAPGLAWNFAFFHSLTGGYASNLSLYDFAPAHVAAALAGLLVSPSRGLFAFTPIVLFSFAGAVLALRRGDPAARLLTLLGLASLALVLNYAAFAIWDGGHCYGPRFLTDAMPVAALLLVYVIPAEPLACARSGPAAALACVAFVAILGYSIAVQAAGAYSGAAGPLWNPIPIDIGREPARIWQLADNQIERNARATYYHYAPNYPTAGSAYAAGFAGQVTAVRAIDGTPLAGATLAFAPGAKYDLTASVINDGRSRWYGYTTAVYNGEAQIRVRMVDAHGALAEDERMYVAGSPTTGATAEAYGTITAPAVPGTYTAIFDPVAFGVPATQQANPAALRVALVVR